MDYENGKDSLEILSASFHSEDMSRNEATTRLHLIDQIFFDCLGWKKESCIAEESQGGEYTDYTFSINNKRVLIVEAKKEGNYFELPVGQSDKQLFSLKTLCADHSNLKSALKQVSDYCQQRGVPVAVVCNGHQLVAFLASRNDGVAPMEGRAVVYDSFESMLDNFKELWNYLSTEGIKQGYLTTILMDKKTVVLPPKLSTSIHNYPGIKGRNPFQADIKIAADLILEDIIKDENFEELFLTECYSPSGALSQYALISKEILSTRYKALFERDTTNLSIVPAVEKAGVNIELLADSLSRRPILLIGDVGVGKTTFIKHLVKIDAKEIFDNAIVLYFDLGTQAALAADFRQFIFSDIEKQLLNNYQIDVDERNFIRGVYNLEIERFRKGLYTDLFDTDLPAFKLKELEFLKEKVSIRDQHLKYAIKHISKARLKQVVVFLDNADQRTDADQQKAFLIAHEIATTWSATVFAALRPETFHNSLKSGTLSGYYPKAFTISPPRIDLVVHKRLAFASKIASGNIPPSSLDEHTKVKFGKLDKLIRIFQKSLDFNDNLMKSIDNISGGNVRNALGFITGFFSSGHVDTKKIIRIFDEEGSYFVPLHEFLRAIIYGDAAYYDPSQSPIVNIFDISTPDPKEHFLLPIFIATIVLLSEQQSDAGFVEVIQVYGHLQDYGYTADQISWIAKRAQLSRLVEFSGPDDQSLDIDHPKALRVSTVGVYHLLLIELFTYIDAIIVDTPILDRETRNKLGNVEFLDERLLRTELFLQYLDLKWKESQLGNDIFDWNAVSRQITAEIQRIKMKVGSMNDIEDK